ncbi:MAG: hypothetical protein Q9180_002148 [Flavoplaca navasiana]
MGKRKASAIELDDDGIHKSKKPRADSAQATGEQDHKEAEPPPIDATEKLAVEKEIKEARAARKQAKRLAKRQHHRDKPEDENAQSREPPGDGAATRIAPAKVVDVAANREKRSQERSPQAGGASIPGQALQNKYKNKNKKVEERDTKERLRPQKSVPDDIKIAEEAKDNKIMRDNFRGRGEFPEHSPDEWYFSRQYGGRMRDIDPHFSTDEEWVQHHVVECLLVAYKTSVNVYSTATSLLLRELRPSHHHRVSDMAMSASDTSLVYISTEAGSVQLWNFMTGSLIDHWITKSSIYALQTIEPADSKNLSNIVYTIERQSQQGSWRIGAHRLTVYKEAKSHAESKKRQRDAVHVRQSREPITSFRVLDQGRIIIATSGSILTLGYTQTPSEKPLKGVSYTWRDIECPEWISCIDVRIVPPDQGTKRRTSGPDLEVARIDIVVGGLKGTVHVYDDLLRQLTRLEKPSKRVPNMDLSSRKQHWHRNTVFSVKWSRDGNYLISGGLETTLVLWQLETGHINTLPHLGAPIEGIVISPSGASYAIRLADNSAMIVSTAELKPTFSIAGVQSTDTNGLEHMKLPYIATVGSSPENMVRPRTLRPLAVNSSKGLLCAIPSTTPSRVPSTVPQPASFLQTIDTSSAQQLSRQALTRTKVTDLNVGPESNFILEPNVILLQLSQDGKWLATVDEWVPPKRDVAFYSYDDNQAIEEQDGRREIYLKFWSRHEDNKVWSLVSRVDDPHASQSGVVVGKNRVLDLVTDPSSTGFATVGEDGVVKTWKASIRQRHNSTVTNKHGHSLVNWNCRSAIELDASALSSQPYTGAKLAYSSDGSCLATALTSRSPWTIHLIDTEARTARKSPYGPYTGSLHGLGIIDRFLIVLSNHLNVWNLVTHELAFAYTLTPQPHPDLVLKPQTKHLSLNPTRGTFAIGLPYVNPDPNEVRTNHHSQVIVFDPRDPKPLASMITQEPLVILTPMHGSPGYLMVDSAAEFQTFAPGRTKGAARMELPTPPATPTRGLEAIYGEGKKVEDPATEVEQKSIDYLAADLSGPNGKVRVEEDDVVVVTQEKLAEVLDCGPAYAMPPVSEMFERVARLYAGSRGA